jgi:hypothetical protein
MPPPFIPARSGATYRHIRGGRHPIPSNSGYLIGLGQREPEEGGPSAANLSKEC